MLIHSEGTYTTHIPVMVKTGRLTGRIIHRDMMMIFTANNKQLHLLPFQSICLHSLPQLKLQFTVT